MELWEYLDARRKFFEERLPGFLPPQASCPGELVRAMEYSLFAGGKRLRPLLTLITAECCGGSLEAALAPAAAIEMVHTYSLIHDDLPAMDDDDLRRGRPTSHKVFGEGMAILAGDALLTHAFSVLAEAPDLSAPVRLALIGELAAAAGPEGMVAGQVLDIQGLVGGDSALLQRMHACKTGALLRAAVRMGAILAAADQETLAGLSAYAASLGLAFQIVDDILDVTATAGDLGKNPGSDLRQNKQTYVTLFGLAGARARAAAEIEAAQAALAGLAGDFRVLGALAEYIGNRHN